MAEGGEENDKDNPFSFKSFVGKKDKRKTGTEIKPSNDDVDIFEVAATTTQRKRDKQNQILVVDEDAKPKQKKKSKNENPFSFKKFLSGSSGSSNVKSSTTNNGSRQGDKDGERISDIPSVASDLPSVASDLPSVASDVPSVASDLPDFVQDHYCDVMGASSPRDMDGFDLPDFTQPSNNIHQRVPDIGDKNLPFPAITSTGSSQSSFNDAINSTVDLTSHEHHTRPRSQDMNSDSDEFDDVLQNDSDTNTRQSAIPVVHSLPDFLSDAARSSNKNCDLSDQRSGRGNSFNGNTELKLQRLQEENEELKRQLDESRKKRDQDSDFVGELQRQLVEQKKKEAEETATMEHAMEQVEQNLSTTTKRAVQAENTATKLKLELKNLQAEVKLLRGEFSTGAATNQHLSDVRERTMYVAEQLSSATKTAESSLRQLLSGVDNLKLLSQVLVSIDKISEDKTTNDKKNTHLEGT